MEYACSCYFFQALPNIELKEDGSYEFNNKQKSKVVCPSYIYFAQPLSVTRQMHNIVEANPSKLTI